MFDDYPGAVKQMVAMLFHKDADRALVADAETREIHRLFTGVTSDRITGIAYTPDRRTMFVHSQHPGNGNPALTNLPAPTDGVTIPRDTTFVITRKNGGIVGSVFYDTVRAEDDAAYAGQYDE